MPIKKEKFDRSLYQIKDLIARKDNSAELLNSICTILKENIDYYDWVGFYLVDEDNKNELVLGPFVGDITEHVRIPFGKGICGQAAATKETFLVPDVTKETNYLSCSPIVKSEIVVPILKQGEVLGELDIDSHSTNPFTDDDRLFLENICSLIAENLF